MRPGLALVTFVSALLQAHRLTDPGTGIELALGLAVRF